MLMKMTNDLDLLRQFAHDRAQDAFTEIVRRHVNLVYSAALCQIRSPQLAEEIAQSVFADLARNAGSLAGGGAASTPKTLTSWLYAVTRRTAIDVIRKESRRQLREQIAVEMTNMNATANDWTQIEPLLDDAMAALDDTDRSAILLRYFENKSLREVGEALGTNDDAAQKRVSRAVERLREFFSKRNVTIGAGGLAVIISANAVQAAPIGLAGTISAAAVLAGTAVSTSALVTATKTIAMTTIQKTLITAMLAVAVGTGFFEAHQAAQLREQNHSLTQQITQLQTDSQSLSNRLAEAGDSKKLSDKQFNELLKLRGVATQSRNEAEVENDPAFQKARLWLAKEAKLHEQFELHPNQWIPEMKYLSKEAWLDKARMADLGTASGMRCAMSNVRTAAKYEFAGSYFTLALSKYLITHNQQLPVSTSELSTCFPPGVNDADAILARYEMINPDTQTNPGYDGFAIVEKSVVDPIEGPVLINDKKVSSLPVPRWPTVTPNELIPLMNAYSDANNHEGPLNILDLVPFATTPEQKEALNKYINSATQLH